MKGDKVYAIKERKLAMTKHLNEYEFLNAQLKPKLILSYSYGLSI